MVEEWGMEKVGEMWNEMRDDGKCLRHLPVVADGLEGEIRSVY